MIVDTHAHFVPSDLLAAIRKERHRFPSVRIIEEGGGTAFSFVGGKPTRPVTAGLGDATARLAWMDAQGIDRQVIGGWTDVFAYELPAAEGEAWCRLANDALLSECRAHPRLVPLAMVPMQDGGRAAAVLRAAIAAGFPGAMIGTLPRGVGSVLDSSDLDPFWAAADETGAVVHVHPSFDTGDARVNSYGLANAVGRMSDALVAVGRLLFSGHVARYRNARFVVPQGAGGLPFLAGRLRRNHQITPGLADPLEALGRIYTDTVLQDARVLRFVIEMLGADRLMMGSDMPFPIGDDEPLRVIDEVGLNHEQAASIKGRLAAKLFRIA